MLLRWGPSPLGSIRRVHPNTGLTFLENGRVVARCSKPARLAPAKAKKRYPRQNFPVNMRMNPDGDMKEIMNTWREIVESWMRPSTLENYNWLMENRRHQEAHQLTKTAFSSYKFQLSGCKFLLDKLIELPLISVRYGYSSAERPASILNKLLKDYDNHRTKQNYENAVRQAEAHQAGELRRSHKLL